MNISLCIKDMAYPLFSVNQSNTLSLCISKRADAAFFSLRCTSPKSGWWLSSDMDELTGG